MQNLCKNSISSLSNPQKKSRQGKKWLKQKLKTILRYRCQFFYFVIYLKNVGFRSKNVLLSIVQNRKVMNNFFAHPKWKVGQTKCILLQTRKCSTWNFFQTIVGQCMHILTSPFHLKQKYDLILRKTNQSTKNCLHLCHKNYWFENCWNKYLYHEKS